MNNKSCKVFKNKSSHFDIKKKAFIEAWIQCFGNISVTCKKVGITRQCYYKWLIEDENFKTKLQSEDVEERLLDYYESLLVNRTYKSDTLLIFALKTKGKRRGYIERSEQSHDISEEMQKFLRPFSEELPKE